jgi:bifunctional DNA-binding transcriptional regulator/antitoxin component of YhaV-PrlF toxin-antitoxin module
MKKQTKVTQDKTQTRATIPKEFVEKFKVTKKDKVEWDDKSGKLKGELKQE